MKKQTLVLGASPNPNRYSYKAISQLVEHGHPVYAFGVRKGEVSGVLIQEDWPTIDIDTVTLYLNPQRQQPFEDHILRLKPKRVIFNPGTENPEFQKRLIENGVEVEVACTLVMLSVGNY